MRKRSPRRATTYGVAAIVSLSLIAASCGGDSDDDATDDNATAGTEATDGSDAESPDAEAPDDSVVEELELDENVIEEPDETPVPGGTLRYGLEADTDGLNPTSSQLAVSGLMMSNAVFDTLTAFDEDGIAVPYLAESVEPAVEGRPEALRDRPRHLGHQFSIDSRTMPASSFGPTSAGAITSSRCCFIAPSTMSSISSSS